MYKIEKEILEQPHVLSRILDNELKSAEKLAEIIRKNDINYILIAARGSSDNAAVYAKYLFPTLCGMPVALSTPSVFSIYQKPPKLENVLVLGISQSGQSHDIISVLREAKKQKAITAVITNDSSSPLAKAGNFVLNCCAGKEKSIAATKTYTAQLMLLALLAAILSKDKKERLNELKKIPGAVNKTINEYKNNDEFAQRYRYLDLCAVIGRGYNYATSFEIALKLKELNYITAEPYSSADFQHGPMAIVEDGYPVLVINPNGALYKKLDLFIEKLREKKAEVIVISDNKNTLKKANTPLLVPVTVPEWLSPVTCVIPGQFLAFYLTLVKGYHPDNPRSLKKITITK
ncbi:MAG: SIS domain-containing protein [Armatimonadota bacterium]